VTNIETKLVELGYEEPDLDPQTKIRKTAHDFGPRRGHASRRRDMGPAASNLAMAGRRPSNELPEEFESMGIAPRQLTQEQTDEIMNQIESVRGIRTEGSSPEDGDDKMDACPGEVRSHSWRQDSTQRTSGSPESERVARKACERLMKVGGIKRERFP
jgi:hypothetical protein